MKELYQLPKEWKRVKLGEVATYLNGRAFKPTEWKDIGKPIIRIQNLNKPEAKYNYTKEQFEERYKVVKGDLLFAWSASLGAYIWKGDEAWLNQHIFKVVPKNFTDKTYLFYLLEKIVQELYAKAHGSGMVHVTKGKFEATEIPLPPKPTQQAIVSKIEELFSELEKGIESLFTAQQQLKTYRQSVLKWAFEGKLSESGFTRLKDEQDEMQNTNPVKSFHSENPDSDKGELPKGWKWVKLDDIISKLDQGWSPKCENEGSQDITEWAVIKTSAVQHGYFLSNENKRLPKELKAKEHHELKAGDILITRAGPRVRVGVCCMIKHTRPKLINCDKVYRINVNNNLVIPEYFELILNSPIYQDEIEKMKSGISDSGLNLTQKKFLQIKIPLPLLVEQLQIVQEIESRLSVADKMEESINQSLQQAETLKQSILKKAFEGKLI